MHTAGIIIEYDPLHTGHVYMLEEVRRRLGADTAVVGVMSGSFTQRGEFAVVGKYARAKAAVESGVDLVLELPIPWAVAGAERFADGGVQALAGTGVVNCLAFGSECGDAAPLTEIAACLGSEAYRALLRERLAGGESFAACRQAAVAQLLGEEKAALLAQPNNILGVEYCKALLRRGADLQPVTILRRGSAHNGALLEGQHPSASGIRELLKQGAREAALPLMAPAMRTGYLAEEAAGRAPVFAETCERAILARLRTMTAADFAGFDEGNEGLGNRLYDASREPASLAEILQKAKTKRYPYARLRRMVLWAYLGLRPGEQPAEIPYLRPLAANETGRALLSRMRKSASIPIVMKAKQIRDLGAAAGSLPELEARAEDLFALAYPDLTAAVGGNVRKEGLVLIRGDLGEELL